MTPTDIALAFILMSDPAVASTTQEAVSAPVTAPVASVGDPCNVSGYSPSCNSGGTGPITTFVAFNRSVSMSGLGFGSASATGNSSAFIIPPGTVLVHSLNMGSEPTSGQIVFAPVGSIGGVGLRWWVSSSPDGSAIGGCGYVGYVEAAIGVSTDGSKTCNLSPGGSYYINTAICASTSSDANCSSPSATTPDRPLTLVMRGSYS